MLENVYIPPSERYAVGSEGWTCDIILLRRAFEECTMKEIASTIDLNASPELTTRILQRRKGARSKTLAARKSYNRTIREQGCGL
jgi:hypothetical protein